MYHHPAFPFSAHENSVNQVLPSKCVRVRCVPTWASHVSVDSRLRGPLVVSIACNFADPPRLGDGEQFARCEAIRQHHSHKNHYMRQKPNL